MKIRLYPQGKTQWLMTLCRIILFLVAIITSIYGLTRMPGTSLNGTLPTLNSEQLESSEILKKHVHVLAHDIGARNIWTPSSMTRTVTYLEKVLTDIGYQIKRQDFRVEEILVSNIEVEIKGSLLSDEIVVVGAHYDTILHCPGANDNGSGIAALLELARKLYGRELGRTVRLVAFANEEPPFFLNDTMGSRQYAIRARRRGEKIVGMISLETMGFFSDKPGSQKYPFPFSFFYPDTADFIAIVGNLQSRQLVRKSIAAFRRAQYFPSEALAAPQFVTGIGWSDHWSFWKEGYQAIMITDTAFYRYSAYHTPHDTAEKLDYKSMARVVGGVVVILKELANSPRYKF